MTTAEQTNYFLLAGSRAEFDRMVRDYLTSKVRVGDKINHARRTWMLDGDYLVKDFTKDYIKSDFAKYGLDVRIYKVGDTYYAYSASLPRGGPKAERLSTRGLTVNHKGGPAPSFRQTPKKPRKLERDPFLDAVMPDDLL